MTQGSLLYKLIRAFFVFCAALFISWALSNLPLMQKLNNVFIDIGMSLSPQTESNNVAIVAIDSKSIAKYGPWPWPRKTHAELLDKLTKAGTNLAVFDIVFSESDNVPSDSDNAFALAIKEHGQVVLAMSAETDMQTGEVTEFLPAIQFISAARAVGHTDLYIDSSGLTRGIYLGAGVGSLRWPALSLAAVYAESKPLLLNWPHTTIKETTPLSLWLRTREILIPFQKVGFPTFSYMDVLSGRISSELAGKTIFIGMTSQGLERIFATPIGVMNGVQFQANAYQSLASNQFALEENHWLYWLGWCVLILIGMACIHFMTPQYYLFSLFVMSLSVGIMALFLLITMQAALPTVAIWFSLSLTYLIKSGRDLEVLEKAAKRDSLTGLLNRREFDIDFESAWREHEKQQKPINLMLLDIDYFKKINDEYGHAKGDDVLAGLGLLLAKKSRRSKEKAYRIGGEEFAIISSDRDNVSLTKHAQSLVDAIQQEFSSILAHPITVSIGYAQLREASGVEKRMFFNQVDRALYSAKAAGRNRALAYQDGM